MNIGKLFKSFVPTGVKQPRHTHGLPSRLGMESTALRWIVGESKACWTCKGDLPDSGGVVRFCSKVCRLRRATTRTAARFRGESGGGQRKWLSHR